MEPETPLPILELKALTVAFPDQPPVVEEVSFTLSAGEKTGVLGLSGSGKSLTAAALLGLLPPTANLLGGSAVYTLADGTTTDLFKLPEAEWRKLRGREISLVFQEPLTALNPVQRVGEQLLEAVRYLCPELKTKKARTVHLKTWLTRVELPDDQDRILKAYPHELSGGQRQRLLIALALLGGPRLLIADEPTTALDTITEKGILDLLQRLCHELNMTLIFITHDLDVLRQTTENALVMARGKVVHRGSTKEVLALPNAGLEALVSPLPEEQGGAAGAGEETKKAVSATEGAVLSVTDLSVSYAGKKAWPWSAAVVHPAVRGVSFTVGPGEWVALAGPSGCGKTTVARCLAGLLEPGAGTVSGLERKDIQMVFQDPFSSLNPSHSITTILNEVLRLTPPPKNTAADLLESVGLPAASFADRRPGALSGGQRQRVAIARALAAAPRLLICDEAVSALDVPLRADILNLLDEIRRRQGIALLFITHDLRLARERADRILIMDRGEIVEEGKAAEVLTHPVSEVGKALVRAL